MELAKIGSKDTYYTCMRELDQRGYLTFCPSPQRGSLSVIRMVPFVPDNEITDITGTVQRCTDSGTSGGPETGHPRTDTSTSGRPEAGHESPDSGPPAVPESGPFIKSENRKCINRVSGEATSANTPSLEEVKLFFREQNYPDIEAQKFWYQYEATGWHLGNTPIRNWQALVYKWAIHASTFSKTYTNYDKPGTKGDNDNKDAF